MPVSDERSVIQGLIDALRNESTKGGISKGEVADILESINQNFLNPTDDGTPAAQSHTHPQSDITGLESALSSLGSLAGGNQGAINDLYAKGRTFAGTITADRQIMVTYARQNAYDGPVALAASGNTDGCTFKAEFDQPTQATLDNIAAETDLIPREGSPTPDITKLNVLVGYIQGNKGYYTWAVFESEYTPPDEDAPVLTFSPANGATDIAVDVSPTITANEPIELVGGGEITSGAVLEGLLTVKEDNASGADIPFSATIDGAKQVITIDITSDLPNSQAVYVAIAPVQDAAGNQTGNQSATFTSVAAAPTGKSLDIADGIGNYLSIPTADGSLLDWGGTGYRFIFEMDFKLPANDFPAPLFWKGTISPYQQEALLVMNSLDQIQLFIHDTNTASAYRLTTFDVTSLNLSLDTWYRLRLRAANFVTGLSIDGGSEIAGSSSDAGSGTFAKIRNSTQPMLIGVRPNVSQAARILVDNVKIWSDSHIATDPFNRLYLLDDDLVDSGPDGEDASIVGTATYSSDVPS